MSVGYRRWTAILAAILVLAMPAFASAIGGLGGPVFGISVAPNGDVLVADASVGILRVANDVIEDTVGLEGVTDVSPVGNAVMWATTGAGDDPQADTGQGLSRIVRHNVTEVVNLFEFEAENNPDGEDPLDSNPFDVQALNGNAALVVDAGGNDLLRADKRGDVHVLAVFRDEVVSTANVKSLAGCPEPGPFSFVCDLPDAIPAQAVPTSVAIGPDGYYYVGELKGFPAPTGESNIWRVSPHASWAECGVSPDCVKVFDGGFTSIIDLAFDRHGNLLVAELDESSWIAVEFQLGGTGGTINRCNVETLACSVVADGIPILTSIALDRHGTLWATRNALIPGGAEVVQIP